MLVFCARIMLALRGPLRRRGPALPHPAGGPPDSRALLRSPKPDQIRTLAAMRVFSEKKYQLAAPWRSEARSEPAHRTPTGTGFVPPDVCLRPDTPVRPESGWRNPPPAFWELKMPAAHPDHWCNSRVAAASYWATAACSCRIPRIRFSCVASQHGGIF